MKQTYTYPDGFTIEVTSRACELCDGTGVISETTPASQEAGEIVDEQVVIRKCVCRNNL